MRIPETCTQRVPCTEISIARGPVAAVRNTPRMPFVIAAGRPVDVPVRGMSLHESEPVGAGCRRALAARAPSRDFRVAFEFLLLLRLKPWQAAAPCSPATAACACHRDLLMHANMHSCNLPRMLALHSTFVVAVSASFRSFESNASVFHTLLLATVQTLNLNHSSVPLWPGFKQST